MSGPEGAGGPEEGGGAPYGRLVLPQVARALALLDRDPASPTWGCFDRPFWHYRTLVDFPGATWQQLVWPLALVARARPEDAALADAVAAGLRWWARIQHRDGSFDEWYRNEHSYCPTAFTTAGACETLLVLGEALPGPVRAAALAAAERAGAWLERRFNPAVMNQNLAAALALWDLATLTGSPRWRRAAEDRYRRVAAAQHGEGWLPEYGGADLGYSTLALDLLAAADARGAGELVRSMAERLAGFLLAVQGAGPGHPGRLGSRGTAHVFPYGAEHFAAAVPAAAALASRWRAGHAAGRLPAPAGVDDRYFAYFYLPQFALAWAHAAPALPPAAAALPELSELPGAGFVVVRRAGWSATVSTRLGGALAVERAGAAPTYLLGYEAGLADGRALVSHHWQTPPEPPGIGRAGGAVTVRVRARFAAARRSRPLVRWAPAFHLATRLLALGRLAEAVQDLIKRRMVNPRPSADLDLLRTVAVGSDAVTVRDEIALLDRAARVGRLVPAAHIAPHSASARQDPEAPPAPAPDPEGAARLTRERRLVVERRLRAAADGTTDAAPLGGGPGADLS